MKKKIMAMTLVLTVAMSAFAFTGAFAAEEPENTAVVLPAADSLMVGYSYINGKVDEVVKNDDVFHIQVTDANNEDHTVILNITDGTRVMDNETGLPSDVNDIKAGDTIAAYHSSITTRSNPPISNAEMILVNHKEGSTLGTFMEVHSVEKNDDGSIRVLNTNGDLLLTIQADTPIAPFGTKNIVSIADIQPGSKLVGYFDIMTLSLPGQAIAQKVVLMPYDYAGSVAVKADNTIQVNGETIVLSDAEKPYRENGTVMVPIRKIAEALDYEVLWDNATQGISLKTNADEVLPASLKIGSNLCTLEDGSVEFSAPAVLKNSYTFVPVDFFKHLGTLKIVVE